MLLYHPDQFEQKAREWAVNHAGAPKRNIVTSPAPLAAKPKVQKTKEQELREQMARCVL
jgi:ubiquitin-conjugating enzyme (huntingtin interacting protein 2)